jgi:hypothetical protein
MAEKMVRTQVYLPRTIYNKLQARAQEQELTLALQIRTALEDYLSRTESEADGGILRADDPIFKMIGMFDSGLGDLSVNHDHYLYGAPRREPLAPANPKKLKEKTEPYATRKSTKKRKGK